MRLTTRFTGIFVIVAMFGLGSAWVNATPAPPIDPDAAGSGWSVLPRPPAGQSSTADGRFLLVAGRANDSVAGTPGGAGRTFVELWWPKDRTEARIGAFDADTRGLWDERTGTNPGDVLIQPNAVYDVFLDPDGDAAARLQDPLLPDPAVYATRSALEPEIDATDAQWLQLFDLPLGAGTLAADGKTHRFVLRVTLVPAALSNGREVNGFKIAYDGSAQITANSVIGFVGGAVDQLVYEVEGNSDLIEDSVDLYEAETTYGGTFEFPFSSAAVCDIGQVVFEEADADWNAPLTDPDQVLTGLPPDDGGRYRDPRDPAGVHRDSSKFLVPLTNAGAATGLIWEFVAPKANPGDPDVVLFSSTLNAAAGHPTGTAPTQGNPFVATTLDPAVFLAHPGVWTLRWRGVDIRNFVFWRLNIPVGDPPPPCTVTGKVLCSTSQRPIPNALITLTNDTTGLEWTARTDPNGAYSVPIGVGPHHVAVSEAVLDGEPLTPVGPTTLPVAVEDPCTCPELVANFTFLCCPDAHVRVRVLCDEDGDRQESAVDSPVPGVQVTIGGTVVPTLPDGRTAPVTVPGGGALTVAVDPNQPALAGKTVLTPPLAIDGVECGADLELVVLVMSPGRVRGIVYCDADGSGTFNAGDTPIADLPVGVTPEDGSLPVAVAVTGPDGRFVASGLATGPWHFTVNPADLPEGATLVTPEDVTVDVGCGDDVTIEFRLSCETCEPGTVHGRVYCDTDKSGGFTAGDRTFSGVHVAVSAVGGAPHADAITGADGTFAVSDLDAGPWSFDVDPATGELAGSGATPKTPDVVTVGVDCGADLSVEWRFECPCTCPTGSTDCTGGYHWVQLEIDMFVKAPVRNDWTTTIRARFGTTAVAVAGLSWNPAPQAPAACQHVFVVTAGASTVRISFNGDSWHGHQDSGILHVTDIWRTEKCRWKVKLKVWACDRPDGKHGCLPVGLCIRPRLDASFQAVCLDLSCTHGPLPKGAVTDDGGNPWYTVIEWLSCKDAECCPPNPCCSNGCCPNPPPTCGCTRR